MDRGAVGQRLRVDRADILHRMVDRADAGGEEQPFRRVDGRPPGPGSRCAASSARGRSFPSPAAPCRCSRRSEVNSPADSVVGTAIERTPGGFTGGRSVRPSAMDRGAEVVELAGLGDIVAQAEADHLRRVGHRPAADGQQRIRLRLARGIGRRDDIDARRVRADLRADARPACCRARRAPGPPHRSAAPACRLPAHRPRWRRSARPPAPALRPAACRRSPAPSAGSGGCPLLHGGQPLGLQNASSAATSLRSPSKSAAIRS